MVQLLPAVSDVAVTVTDVVPDMVPVAAVIMVWPGATVIARPPGLTVRTPGLDELQSAVLEKSAVVPSVKMPLAVNCLVRPLARDRFPGVIDIVLKVACITVTVVLPDIVPDVAVITAVPAETPVARPFASIVATAGSDEVHVADAVRSADVPSDKAPVAVNCLVAAIAMLEFVGVIAIEFRGAVTVNAVLPDVAPEVAVIVAVP